VLKAEFLKTETLGVLADLALKAFRVHRWIHVGFLANWPKSADHNHTKF
jgi:hypothetical protein